MNVIIPCSGLGTRFSKAGFNIPKPLIRCMLQPFLCWILDGLKISEISSYVYITIVYDENFNNHYEYIASKYDNVFIIYLNDNTKGASDTVFKTLDKIPENRMHYKTLCLDCDNFYTLDVLKAFDKHDNGLLTFKENTLECYSFVDVDDNDNIIDIVEKVKISSDAVCGAYCFESANLLKKYTREVLDDDISSELFLSCAVKKAILDGVHIKNIPISTHDYICVGTPSHMYSFYNNISVKPIHTENGLITPKRICFDLDQTLVTKPQIKGDYTTVLPIQRNIDLCNYLKKLNNYIIIHTARRMQTHNGNIGSILKDVGKITLHTLDEFKILYDEIVFGKPYADFYIDDKSINSNDNLQKVLGIYYTNFETRKFNTIESDSLQLIKKTSCVNIKGEIYYYSNIPIEIKDMFPIFVDHDEISYRIEKIIGTTVSELYVNNSCTDKILRAILSSLERIHNSQKLKNDSYALTFYIDKLKQRFSHKIYEDIRGAPSIYKMLEAFFENYKFNVSNIHGDPVFTNIIVNKFEKLKFIDMRGNFGDNESLLGDPLYDFAKVKQSIIGYDYILKEVDILKEQKEQISNLKKCFDEYIIQLYSKDVLCTINMITKYLIFTMIPLHIDRNLDILNKFINLIYEI